MNILGIILFTYLHSKILEYLKNIYLHNFNKCKIFTYVYCREAPGRDICMLIQVKNRQKISKNVPQLKSTKSISISK